MVPDEVLAQRPSMATASPGQVDCRTEDFDCQLIFYTRYVFLPSVIEGKREKTDGICISFELECML